MAAISASTRPTKVTGERITSPRGGFNPTWQRHVAAYRLAAPLLPPGRVLDLGCGIGHSYGELAPRETVGLDIDPGALEGQLRETVVADMRALPFAAGQFASVLSVHSIEHVPDPERAVAEAARVLEPAGVAAFITPNRLTFGRPDEIVDPYHHVELDGDELRSLCASGFGRVELRGIFGSPRYMEIFESDRAAMNRVLRLDVLRLRRLLPRRARARLYDEALRRRRRRAGDGAEAISAEDFELRDRNLEAALDLCAICRQPGR